jgi:CheY-like chemotaxis protein
MGVSEYAGVAGLERRSSDSAVRILVVDDHDDTVVVMRTILERRGYHVMAATSLEDARRQAASGFDLLLCDIALPDGSGIELLERLSETGPVRAIAMSGFGTHEDIQRSVAAGFQRHLTKTFTADALFEAIASAIT